MSFNKTSESERREIAKRYAAGETTTQLANAFCVTPTTVVRIVKDSGGKTRAKGRKIPDGLIFDVLKEWASGASQVSLAKKYGRSTVSIHYWLKRANPDFRSLRPRKEVGKNGRTNRDGHGTKTKAKDAAKADRRADAA